MFRSDVLNPCYIATGYPNSTSHSFWNNSPTGTTCQNSQRLPARIVCGNAHMQPWDFEENQQDDVESRQSPKTKNVHHEDLTNDEREIALTKYRSAPSKCYRVLIPQIPTITIR